MQELAQAIARFFRDHRDEMVERLAVLVQAETPTLDPKTQRRVFGPLTEWLDDAGYRAVHFRGRSSGGQLFARPSIRTRRGFQVLVGHSDTVWPEGTLDQMPLVVSDGIVKGPGCYDMKAGLVQGLFALRALQHLGVDLPLDPVFFVNSDEEMGSTDSERKITQLARRARRVFILEPGTGREGHLKTARKGVGQFQIRIHGRAAHAGVEPEAGASAIVELAHVIQALDALNDRDEGVTVNVGTIDGGTRPNIVAPISGAIVDVRVPTADHARKIEKAIHGLQPVNAEVRLEISGGVGRAPMERTPRNRVLWRQARAAAQLLGMPLEQSTSGGGSDGNITSLYSATLDGLGAVGGGAHAPHEFVEVDRMVERGSLLALLLASPDESDLGEPA